MSIVFEQVAYTYPGAAKPALAGIDLSVETGEFLGIIGHTGSGKSTLIQHLNALLIPTRGRVLVDGVDTADKAARRSIRFKVGIVFQYPEYQLFGQTVAEDVAFGPRNLGLPEAEVEQRVDEALLRVGLNPDEVRMRSPFEFSGGQKRRIALAGTLAMRPEVLVLDEPMAGLDPGGRGKIMALIENLHAEGLTIVMVSHSMEDVAAHADRIVVMKDGGIVFCDEPRKVFSHAEELRSIGLGVPIETKFAHILAEGGLPIATTVLTFEELVDAIAEAFGGGARG